MAIDYKALLRKRKIRLALGNDGLAKSAEDEDYLPNFISENAKTILTLAWEGGLGGANWITEWQGFYFFNSSDYDDEGPIQSLDQALGDERFWVETSEPELTSKVVPLEKLLEMGKAVAGQDGEAVFINGTKYVLTNDSLVEQQE